MLIVEVLHIDASAGPMCSTFAFAETPERIIVDAYITPGPQVWGLNEHPVRQIEATLKSCEPGMMMGAAQH